MAGLDNIIVWREAVALAAAVETATRHLTGRTAEDVASQMIRAADSITANIAEGYGRGVSGDGIRHFVYARGSSTELESHFRQAIRNRRMPEPLAAGLASHTGRVRYLIQRYIESIERRLK